MRRLLTRGVLGLAALGIPLGAAAQSTSATVYGVAIDEQRAVLPGVAITLENLDTGDIREATSDGRGVFRIIGDKEPLTGVRALG